MLATHVDALLQQCQDVASGSRDPETKFRQIVKLILEIYAVSRDRHVVMLTCLDALPKNHREEIVAKQRKLIAFVRDALQRSEEHTSELQSLLRISYAVFCLKTKKKNDLISIIINNQQLLR